MMNKKTKYIIIFSLLICLTIGTVFTDYARQLGALLADASTPNPGHSLLQIEGSENLATKTYVNDAISGISGSNWTVSGSNVYRSSGNVGIGTTTPSAKLHVNGNIIANNPTDSNHVATKDYVDSQPRGFSTCQTVTGSGTVYCPTGWSFISANCGSYIPSISSPYTFCAGQTSLPAGSTGWTCRARYHTAGTSNCYWSDLDTNVFCCQ